MDPSNLRNLRSAVETILNVNASQLDRENAHRLCEEFKETSPYCIECGLILVDQQYTPIIRHFGLQLLEHTIKFKWTEIPIDKKELLKRESLVLISECTDDILKEEIYIKDAVSRIVLEIMKHEWPNLWPNLMSSLYQLCLLGPTQTELVLKVFLRLVEDIVIFQNLHHPRRREIMNALTANMGEIFDLFTSLLQDHTRHADTLANFVNADDIFMRQRHLMVCKATLETLSGYLDWVAMTHLTANDNRLLQMLCVLLSHTDLQMLASECLLVLVGRRGKAEERMPLLMLFDEGAMSTIWNAALAANRASTDERFYVFLQKLCQILVDMGRQICFLWGCRECTDVGQPPNFKKYLDALLAFTQHPSQMLSSYTLTLWAQFLRHEQISQDPVFQAVIPGLIQICSVVLKKVGFPTQRNSPSCDYARLDFDNDEEFILFFSKYRAETSEILRQATVIKPVIAIGFAFQWLRSLIIKPIESGGEDALNCNLSSPSFLEWDALTVFLESIMARIKLENQSVQEITDGVTLLNTVLNFETQDPLILSCLLSCLSALFIFLKHKPDTLPKVLQKIFSAVVFNLPGQTKSTRSRAVINLRQHACSIVVKICKEYQDLMFPVFDELFKHIQSIGNDPEQLSQMERTILMEATVLISNKFNNYEKQSAFLEEVLKPVNERWLSDEYTNAFSSAENLMSYVGLDQAAVEPSLEDICGINRSHVSNCTHMILSVIKRAKYPADIETAKAGGFVIGTKPNGEFIMRNPASPHITRLLGNVFYLIKSMNMLFCDECLKRRHTDYLKSYDLPESDVQTLFGILPPCIDNTGSLINKQPLERMQHFLTLTYDICCHILGNAGQCMGSEFYGIPNVANSLVQTALCRLDVMPDYRLRSVIRVFMKPYIQHCSSEYYSTAVLPILSYMCPFMYQMLEKKWMVINQRCQKKSDDDETPESKEVLEEQLTRQLSREYLDLLCLVCLNKRNEPIEDKMADEEVPAPSQSRDLSDLGKLCITNEQLFESMVLCVLSGLSWMDTPTCNRCIHLTYPILKQLISDKNMSGAAAYHCYFSILTALQNNGQHEGTQSMLLGLGLQLYELFRPNFQEVHILMLQIPSCTVEALKSFDDKVINTNGPQKMGDKKKKEAYKKLVADVIGKYVGEQFKREVHYQSLPNLFHRSKPRQLSLDDIEHNDMGLCNLFMPKYNFNK